MNTVAKKSLRLFYALWPDDATRASLTSLQMGLAGRATRSENLHLTLAFLGDRPASDLPALQSILTRLPKTEIILLLDRIGYFPRNKIAWVGMPETPDALTNLQDRLVQALDEARIPFDQSGTFKPHITLAREAPPPEMAAFAPIPWHADCAALVQSTTDRDGVVYKVLAARQLNSD